MFALKNLIRLILLTILSQATGVILVSFSATYIGGSIQVDWETSSEHDIIFFRLERSTQANAGYEALYEYIPAEGDSENGWFYGVVDDDVTLGTTYYYRLVAVDSDEIESYYGPIVVNAGNNPIPTTIAPTLTATPFTPSVTPSNTPTQPPSSAATSTPESQVTPPPSLTPEIAAEASLTPAPVDSLPTLAYTLEATSTETPTDHLAEASSPTGLALLTPTLVTEQPAEPQSLLQLNTLLRIALLSVVFGVWAILAVVGYIYLRKNFS